MLELVALEAGHGETQVVHGLDLALGAGEVHALLGRNGVGKTTTLRTIVGLLDAFGGDVRFRGESILGRRPFEIARAGIAYVPETRDVFGSLSVLENLRLAARLARGPAPRWTIERVLDFFPNLAGRLANGGNELSGGEQQMLAIGRALLMNPALLILDEPTEGLAPIVVRQILDKLLELKGEGMTLLLVEQNVRFATRLADEISVLGRGRRVWGGTAAAFRADAALQRRWLGV